ncbi:dCTP deaminase domain-containing protein [Streptomyces griseoaurantiacus]|uniref:dCTP deaminase domain-containing protein n=1 Tax=Streptomyces griseoaurantiacus TaxID=68213 RepID=UPI003254F32D
MVRGNSRRQRGTGTLLSQQDLLAELTRSERIFRAGTWKPEQLLGAGYSVRLSDDLLVIPDSPGDSRYTAVKGENVVPEFTLAPGDTALISTIERFSLDFDITATIGDRFGLAAKGLLVLHGSSVHPGYGRAEDPEDGTWHPKDDERLYFIVANVGPKNITMRKGDALAHLHFFDIDRIPEGPVPNVGFEHLSTLFGAGQHREDGGLSYFRDVKDLRAELEAERARTEARLSELTRALADNQAETTRQVTETQRDVNRVTDTSNMIVVFGVFLITTTLLGVVLVMLGSLADKLGELDTWKTALLSTLAVLYAGTSVTGVVLVARAAGRGVFGRQADRRGDTGE